MKRICWLLGAAAAAAAAAAAPAFAPDSAIVIGAGMSGLAAAAELCARGYRVTVVEARDRLGGRTSTATVPTSGLRVEAGAGWLHGCKDNALYELAEEHGIPTRIGDDDSGASWTVSPAAAASGVARSERVGEADEDAWAACAERFAEHYEDTSDDREEAESLQAVFDAWATKRGLSGLARSGCYAVARSESADLEYGATMAQLSAAWFSEGDEMRGAERYVDPSAGGYNALVTLLRDKAIDAGGGKCAVRTSAAVARVVLEPAQGGVRVELADGSSLSAAFAVTTLPLGVLKGGAVAFSPPLPARKQQAVARLGMGLLNKVVLVYARQFWADAPGGDTGWLQLVFPQQPAAASWAASGTALQFWNGAKFGLKGASASYAAVALLVGASTAEAWEQQTDAVLVARADALFRSLWPAPSGEAPRLVESLVTRWRSDRYANGSYSYLPPGARPQDRAQLCAAQDNTLFWAGEHCSINHPATAHGAYESGLAAARAAAAARPRSAAVSAEAPAAADAVDKSPALRVLLPCVLVAAAVALGVAAFVVRRRSRAGRVEKQQSQELTQL